jgi:hypothetical protein
MTLGNMPESRHSTAAPGVPVRRGLLVRDKPAARRRVSEQHDTMARKGRLDCVNRFPTGGWNCVAKARGLKPASIDSCDCVSPASTRAALS